jgi:hypothetical protein
MHEKAKLKEPRRRVDSKERKNASRTSTREESRIGTSRSGSGARSAVTPRRPSWTRRWSRCPRAGSTHERGPTPRDVRGRVDRVRRPEPADRRRGLKFAEFWFTDLAGRPWRITMPAGRGERGLFADGVAAGRAAGRGILGRRDDPDAADMDAVYVDPTASAPSLAMFCDVLDPDLEGAASPRAAPRAGRDAVRLVEEGVLGAETVLGAEPEFLLLDPTGAGAARAWSGISCAGSRWPDGRGDSRWTGSGPGPRRARAACRCGPVRRC